jgi:hypothetical protein
MQSKTFHESAKVGLLSHTKSLVSVSSDTILEIWEIRSKCFTSSSVHTSMSFYDEIQYPFNMIGHFYDKEELLFKVIHQQMAPMKLWKGLIKQKTMLLQQ